MGITLLSGLNKGVNGSRKCGTDQAVHVGGGWTERFPQVNRCYWSAHFHLQACCSYTRPSVCECIHRGTQQNPGFWSVSIVLFAGSGFTTGMCSNLDFRHITCALLSRDGAQIPSLRLCLSFWMIPCPRPRWKRTIVFTPVSSLYAFPANISTIYHGSSYARLHMFDKYMQGEKNITGCRLPYFNLVGIQLDQWSKALTIT